MILMNSRSPSFPAKPSAYSPLAGQYWHSRRRRFRSHQLRPQTHRCAQQLRRRPRQRVGAAAQGGEPAPKAAHGVQVAGIVGRNRLQAACERRQMQHRSLQSVSLGTMDLVPLSDAVRGLAQQRHLLRHSECQAEEEAALEHEQAAASVEAAGAQLWGGIPQKEGFEAMSKQELGLAQSGQLRGPLPRQLEGQDHCGARHAREKLADSQSFLQDLLGVGPEL